MIWKEEHRVHTRTATSEAPKGLVGTMWQMSIAVTMKNL